MYSGQFFCPFFFVRLRKTIEAGWNTSMSFSLGDGQAMNVSQRIRSFYHKLNEVLCTSVCGGTVVNCGVCVFF